MPHNLPLPLSSFVGRDEELVEVASRLRDFPLVTLTGPPGIGKTRLALELTLRLADEHPDGVWLVELAPIANPALVPRAVAAALSVREQRARPMTETLIIHLRGRRSLLLLDNCEHVIGACAELATSLLQSCPDLTILATSQEPLAVAGEHAWRVPPLPVPAAAEAVTPETMAAYHSVRLFCDRARAVHPGFELTVEVAPAVVEICRRVDGIALAIELAAARTEMLSPPEIASRLDDRFGLLTGGNRSALPRQQTLRAALDWSFELLGPAEQALLGRLSVFAGGFTLDAVEEVCAGDGIDTAEVFDLLARLVARSLVVSEPLPRARYHLLETIRLYAAERLGPSNATSELRSRHAKWCVLLAERAEPELVGPRQRVLLARLEVEHENFRTAFDWCTTTGDSDGALRLGAALTLFWRIRGHFSEGRDMLTAALEAGEASSANTLRARAMWGRALLNAMLGAFGVAVPDLEAALDWARQADDTTLGARSLLMLGNCALFVDQPPVALDLLARGVDLAREAGDTWCLAHGLALAGSAYNVNGDTAAAQPLLEECLAVARQAQDRHCLAFGLNGLGYTALCRGDLDQAEVFLDEAVAVSRDLGETYELAAALTDLAQVAITRGDHGRAHRLLDEGIALAQDTGSSDAIVYPLEVLGTLAVAEGDPDAARRYFERALAQAESVGGTVIPAVQGLGEVAVLEGNVGAARARFDEALAMARARGHKLPVARALFGLAGVARQAGDPVRAMTLHHEALELRKDIGDSLGITESLEALGGLAAEGGSCEHATRLFAAAASLRQAGGYARGAPRRQQYEEALDLARAGLDDVAFDTAWAQGGTLSALQAASYAAKGRGARVHRPLTGWASLTGAERDVAVLAAEGLTNPEIGERLFISRDTVKGHLSRVFGKLNVSSRKELAAKQPES